MTVSSQQIDARTNPSVDILIENAGRWQAAFAELRSIILTCDVQEIVKWGQPCYAHNGKNVVLIHGFKDYCAVLLMKGALLQDAEKVLIQQTPNVQAARQMRFTSVAEVEAAATILKRNVEEAIGIEKAGMKVQRKATADIDVPEEFRTLLESRSDLRGAFDRLTPGRQRAYMLWLAAPKQAKTRIARVEKATARILAGLGLDD